MAFPERIKATNCSVYYNDAFYTNAHNIDTDAEAEVGDFESEFVLIMIGFPQYWCWFMVKIFEDASEDIFLFVILMILSAQAVLC